MPGATNDLTLKVGFDIDRFNTELNKTTNKLNQWGNNITSQLKGLAAGFGALALGRFAIDAAKLAGEADGVRNAFEKLPGSIRLMQELKQATAGTVSELDLMKRAVQASNFDISLQALPKLLEFAAVRAQQTGQSVDYLVDSIVTGIGRKSLLILDNLGLSSVRINEELKKTPNYAEAIGNIASQELEKMGTMTDNAATKVERLNASFQNLTVAIGDSANAGGILGSSIDAITGAIDIMASKNLSFLQKLAGLTTQTGYLSVIAIDLEKQTKAANREHERQAIAVNAVNKAMASRDPEFYIESLKGGAYYTEILAEYTRRLKEEEDKRSLGIVNITNLTAKLNELQEFQKIQTGEQLAQTNREIVSIQAKIKVLKELGTSSLFIPPKLPPFQVPEINVAEIQKSLDKLSEQLVLKIDIEAPETEEIDQKSQAIFDRLVARGERFREAMVNANQIIEQSIENLLNGVGAALGDIASGLGGADLIWASMLASVGAMAIQLGQLAIATGISIEAIKTALQTLNPAAAVVAGVALVALGKLVSNKAQSIASRGGGGSYGGSSGGGFGGANDRLTPIIVQQGQRIPVEITMRGDAGKMINAMVTEQNRRDAAIKG